MTTAVSAPPDRAGSGEPQRRRRKRPRTRAQKRRRRLVVLVVILALLTPLGVSYGRAMTAPGYASWSTRSVDWLRDIGAGPVVDWVENWWFTHHQPPSGGGPAEALAATHPTDVRTVPGSAGPVTLPRLSGVSALDGEGVWHPDAPGSPGHVPMWTSWFRPDPGHTGVVVGVAWLDQSLVSAQLIPGTVEPGGSGWQENSQVPPSLRSSLVAAFNSGWKFRDAHDGYYVEGREVKPLRDGAASLVVGADGRVTIAKWGTDATLGPDVVAVRQNLDLVIDGGQVVPGLDSNAGQHWGSAHNQYQYTWRSGIGTDRNGNLVYVAGQGLTLHALADAMLKAGVQRGMELDIHPGQVTFTGFQPDPQSQYGLAGTKLLPSMPSPSHRYLYPDQRDFVAILLRPNGARS